VVAEDEVGDEVEELERSELWKLSWNSGAKSSNEEMVPIDWLTPVPSVATTAVVVVVGTVRGPKAVSVPPTQDTVGMTDRVTSCRHVPAV
jgi:hypothetical protein